MESLAKMFFSALSQFTGGKSCSGGFLYYKSTFANDPNLETAVPHSQAPC